MKQKSKQCKNKNTNIYFRDVRIQASEKKIFQSAINFSHVLRPQCSSVAVSFKFHSLLNKCLGVIDESLSQSVVTI